ncbi:MAG: hypothetical protein O7D91_21795 [Planctomycetota bacterium]|nr:hypothetical protein [Planctomycetota bacterium]
MLVCGVRLLLNKVTFAAGVLFGSLYAGLGGPARHGRAVRHIGSPRHIGLRFVTAAP